MKLKPNYLGWSLHHGLDISTVSRRYCHVRTNVALAQCHLGLQYIFRLVPPGESVQTAQSHSNLQGKMQRSCIILRFWSIHT